MNENRFAHFLPVSILLMPILFFYSSILFGTGTVCGGDFINQFVPWRKFALDQLSQGNFPGWNPLLFCGTPFYANIQVSLYYPFNLLHFLLPIERVFSVSLVFHHALAAVGMYAFLQSIFRNPSSAVIGALVYTWSGFLLTHAHDGHFIHVRAYAWIPFVLWAQNGLQSRLNWYRAAGMVLAFAGMFYGGHTQIPLYIFYIVMFRSVWWGWVKYRQSNPLSVSIQPAINTLLVLLISIAISMPVLLPLFQLSKQTAGRAGGADYSFAVSDSMPPGHVVTLIAPFFYGDPTSPDRESQFWETRTGFHEICGYTGILPIILFILSWMRRTTLVQNDGFVITESRFFGVIACCGIFFALGEYNPLYSILYYGLPGWSFFRVPGRLLLLWVIGISVCSAAGWQIWSAYSLSILREKSAFKTAAVFSALIIVLTVVLFVSKESVIRGLREFEVNRTLEIYNLPDSSRLNVSINLPQELFEIRYEWMFSSSFTSCLILVCGWLLFMASKRWKFSFSWVPISLVIATDLLYFSYRFVETKPNQEWRQSYYPQTELVAFLQENAEGYRVLCLDDAIGHPGLEYHPELRPNRLMYYGIQSARGYDPIILKPYTQWINRMYGNSDDTPQGGLLFFPQIHSGHITQLNVMNVKFVVTTQSLSEPFILIWSDSTSGMKVYKNPDCFERVFWENERNDNRLEIVSQSSNRIDLNVHCVEDNRLVFSQVYYPGWQVEVVGEWRDVEAYLDTFVSVRLKKGSHQVRFQFTPRWMF